MTEKTENLIKLAVADAKKWAPNWCDSEELLRLGLLDQKIQENLVLFTVKACIEELEISKECDPYTGQLFKSEKNVIISAQIDMLKEVFNLKEIK